MRHDTFLTKVTERKDRPYHRLWIEDSFGRLSRNGFTEKTPWEPVFRPGVGLTLKPALIASNHVSKRHGALILSFESRDLSHWLTAYSRVKVSVNLITVAPSLRLFSVAKATTDEWKIRGEILTRPDSIESIMTARPMRHGTTPALLDAELTKDNLVFATEVMTHAKPARVRLSGEALLTGVAGQFLREIGYETTEGGEFVR